MDLNKAIRNFLQLNKKKNVWYRVFVSMAAVVVFITTYMLILPALTKESDAYCGMEEHTHTEACYTTTKTLICGQEESEGHQHSDSCYETEKELICGQEESEDHQHTDECYKETQVLVCGKEESEGHQHTDECYEEEQKLTCGMEEHTHTLQCFSNPDADVEQASDWEETMADIKLTGVRADDVVAIAQSQLGYQESTKNYEVQEDGETTMGYTRYGAWYGEPYGEWDAMFASFCYYYAGIDTSVMPEESSCVKWVKELNKADLYHSASSDYQVKAGDLVFFDLDDTDDVDVDHVGIVASVTYDNNDEILNIEVIESDPFDKKVKKNIYEIDNDTIVGFGELTPEKVEDEETEATTETKETATTESKKDDAEATTEVAKESTTEATTETVAETTTETAKDSTESTTEEATTEDASKATTETVADATTETAKDSTESTAEEATTETATEATTETASEATTEATAESTAAEGTFEASASLSDNTVITVSGANDVLPDTSYDSQYEIKSTETTAETTEATTESVAEDKTETAADTSTAADSENKETEATETGAETTSTEAKEETNSVNVTVQARELSSEETSEILEKYGLTTDDPMMTYTFYDITLLKDGIEIEPNGTVTLTISGMDISEGDEASIIHIDEEAEQAETLECDVAEDGTLTADTDHFSVYGITNKTATGNAITGSNWRPFSNLAKGGTYYLANDITVSTGVTIASDINTTLNLNGHKISFTGTGNLITIQSGGTFTLEDLQETAETVTENVSVSNNWGNTATYNNGTLTYYVTTTSVTNSATGATTEKVDKHVVKAAGLIECSSGGSTPIQITGGTFTMKSGMIAGSKYRAIYASNATSTINLEGGYICGNNVSSATQKSGGAIYCAGNQTVNLTGTVIAANTATRTGGGIYIINGTLNISDNGIISGNICDGSDKTSSEWGESTNTGGAGVYAEGTGTTINMSGGYVTNNKFSLTGAYFDGGGGFLLKKGTLNISDSAKITGNYSGCGGGAIKTARSNATTVNMTGGFVSSNYAGGAEGGGMNFDNNGVGYITAGYITNNSTNKEAFEHWGGGGLFCSDGAQLFVEKVLITENVADGYGGGVAGCSTGRVYICVEDGGAVFDNSASGTNLSGKASAKSADREYAAKDSIFLNNGYADYYCALSSSVDGGMLGGGTANWTGSMDGVAVTSNSRDDVLVAANIMGLTSNPSTTDKSSAESATKVYINGNYSFTHGGGILANGYLLIGNPDEITVPARLNIMGTKQYLDGDDPTKDYLVKANLGDDETKYPKFYFAMVDSEGNVVATGENGWDNDTVADATNYNRITFTKPISLTTAGTFTYKIYETDETNQVNVVTDTNKFTIVITTSKVDLGTITDADGKKVSRYQIQITNVTITDSNGKEWYNGDPGDDQMHIVNMPMSSTGFVNYKNDKTGYTVKKVWADSSSVDHSKDTITVKLYRNGEVATDISDNTVTLNKDNSWSYEWKDLALSDNSGNAYKYSVKEEDVTGYIDSYETTTDSSTSTSQKSITVAAGTYWVPVTSGDDLGDTTYLIVSKDGSHIFYINSNNADTWTSSTFVKSVVNTSGSLTVNGTTYSNWIADSVVSNNNKFKRDYYSDKKCYVFKNQAVTSYISNESNDSIKSTNGQQYGGAVKMSGGKLMIQGKAMANAYSSSSTWRYVCYANGIFYASDSDTNAVVLYKSISFKYDKTATVTVYDGLTCITSTTITNTPIQDVNFKLNIHKVAEKNPSMALKDAKFKLLDSSGNALKFSKDTSTGYYTPNTSGSETLLISSVTGYINIKDLPGGTYTLHEYEAPSGYGTAEDQTITLDENTSDTTLDIEVQDPEKNYVLPNSGGMGTTLFTFTGIILIAGAGILLILKHKGKLGNV